MNKLSIISLAVGSIIGWGAFIFPGDLFLSKIGLINSIFGLILGALLIIFILEKNYNYLRKKYPISGGEYIYTKNILGENHSFICGWFLSLAYICIIPLNATAIPMIFNVLTKDKYLYIKLYEFYGYSIYLSDVLITSFFIIVIGIFNIKSISLASYFQKIMVLFLVGIILLFFSLILAKNGIYTDKIITHIYSIKININSILQILLITPWAYVGFDFVSQTLEELKFPIKESSKVTVLSLVIGMLLYIILLLITAYGVSYKELLENKNMWATVKSINSYFGYYGLIFLGISLFSGVICGMNGFYINASKLLVLMAKEKQLPMILKNENEKKAPKNAIIFIMIISLITPWLGRKVLVWIVNMSSLGISISYIYIYLW